ncbi:MAG: PAS domain S-box protein [Chloroflexaceae bacterium]|nr:PAS domain S-box protein [Chloroflexaceae bacterium]
MTDPQGRIQEVNQKMTFLLETEGAWLLGKPLSAFIDLADAPQFRELLQHLPKQPGLQTVTLRFRPPRCSLFTAEVTVTAMRDGKGTLLGYRWLVRDISARLVADAALFESEERFRQLAENIDAAFWVLDYPQRRVVYVSPAYQRLWGLDSQALYRDFRTWTARVHPDDQVA